MIVASTTCPTLWADTFFPFNDSSVTRPAGALAEAVNRAVSLVGHGKAKESAFSVPVPVHVPEAVDSWIQKPGHESAAAFVPPSLHLFDSELAAATVVAFAPRAAVADAITAPARRVLAKNIGHVSTRTARSFLERMMPMLAHAPRAIAAGRVLAAYDDEDGSTALELVLPDRRIGFCFERDSAESSWFIVNADGTSSAGYLYRDEAPLARLIGQLLAVQ